MFSWNNKLRLIHAVHVTFLLMVLVPFLLWDEAIYDFTTNYLLKAGSAEVAGIVVLLLSVDVFLPVPSSVVGTGSSLLLGWQLGFLSTLAGLMLGSCLGFVIGYLFRQTFQHRYFADAEFRQVSYDLANYGFLLLIALRGVPILAEMSVLAAGFHRFSVGRFMIAMVISNSILAAIHTYLGVIAAATESDYFFALSFLLIPLIGYGLRLYWKQHKLDVLKPK
ncbi:MAG: 3-dehydroquinate synthase [Candidatus Azotimanducaceae bacterium]|jgi:3-dehydroquinate synthase